MGAFNKEDVIYLILSRDVYSTFSLLVRPVGAGRAFFVIDLQLCEKYRKGKRFRVGRLRCWSCWYRSVCRLDQ